MNTGVCYVCHSTIDPDDNFCRRCGAAVGHAPLPAVRSHTVPMVWHPHIPRVVKGAAVMAAGTVGQYLFRRAIGRLLGGGEKGRQSRAIGAKSANDGMVDEAQIITETIMMRRVRVRRQA